MDYHCGGGRRGCRRQVSVHIFYTAVSSESAEKKENAVVCIQEGEYGMFDFNGDGHTDPGEQYTGYKIFEDVTKSGPSGGRLRGKLSGL